MSRKNILIKGAMGALLLMAIVGLVGCEEASSNGTRISAVKFAVDEGKAITGETDKAFSASIEMPTLDSLYWGVTAETEDPAAYGKGTIVGKEMGLPTGLKYSYGNWHFTLNAYDLNGDEVYTGSTDCIIDAKQIDIPVTVSLCEGNGVCNLTINFTTTVEHSRNVLRIYVNGYMIKSLEMIDSDGDGIVELSYNIGAGGTEQNIKFEIVSPSYEILETGSCRIRTIPGRDVTLNVQTLKGSGGFDISVEGIDILL